MLARTQTDRNTRAAHLAHGGHVAGRRHCRGTGRADSRGLPGAAQVSSGAGAGQTAATVLRHALRSAPAARLPWLSPDERTVLQELFDLISSRLVSSAVARGPSRRRCFYWEGALLAAIRSSFRPSVGSELTCPCNQCWFVHDDPKLQNPTSTYECTMRGYSISVKKFSTVLPPIHITLR
jgi:hypothetical protein